MQTIRYIAIAIAFSAVFFVVGYLYCYENQPILDRCELQVRLNQLEPENPLVLDCVIGPNTIGKLDRVTGNQWGIVMYEKYMR